MTASKILIVDDEIIIARELEVRLKALGYDVPAIASSAREAIELTAEYAPDLVLMDIVLKGDMDGIEAAAEIRRRHRLPIIYVTAYTDRATLERARVTEPFGYIVKPFSERELEANIEMALYKHGMDLRLRKVEQWFVTATEEIGDGVIATDGDGSITLFNAAAVEITAWSKEEAIGRPVEEVLRLVDRRNGLPISLRRAFEGPIVCLADETILVDRSERTIPVDSTTSCIRNRDEEPTGTVSVVRDVVRQRNGALTALNADVVLAAGQALTLRGMLQLCAESMVRNLNASVTRIWTINTTGEALHPQATAGIDARLNGIYGKVRVGESTIGTIASRRAAYLTTEAHNDPFIEDREWVRREGMNTFAGYPLLVDDRLVGVMMLFSQRVLPRELLGALDSISNTIALGIERKRLEEQLRQAQKMEAIGQLAGGIAHDFNNLLTIISGYSQLILRRDDIGEEPRALVGQIAAAGDRAAALTRQLLTFSRRQVLETQVVDLNALVADMDMMLRRLLGESINLASVLDATAGRIVADPGQIEQVIMNLAVNASDAMPSGGKLTVETRNVTIDQSFTQMRPSVAPGEYVLLAVSDTGCGMSQETIAHIFEPFFTTKRPGEGTGLGLATVYGIIRQSGGHIEVYSELDIGTTFKIYLPRVASEENAARSTSTGQSLATGSETILLVEDENAVRSLARYILQECGYMVLEAADGPEALEICAAHSGPISLLLTDVVLPGMPGRAVSERMGELYPGIRTLYMSGYTDDAVIRHGVLQAETSFIQKPFSPSALAAKVREVLDA